jgi:16S rRNA C1402 N4-methylase RsmH
MRLDKSKGKTAYDIVNFYEEKDLKDIFWKY